MLFQPIERQKSAKFAGSGDTNMQSAILALVSALSLAGVGTTAMVMSGDNQMMGMQPMMGDGGNGMHGGDAGGHHGGCHCCDGDEHGQQGGNETGGGPIQLQFRNGP